MWENVKNSHLALIHILLTQDDENLEEIVAHPWFKIPRIQAKGARFVRHWLLPCLIVLKMALGSLRVLYSKEISDPAARRSDESSLVNEVDVVGPAKIDSWT